MYGDALYRVKKRKGGKLYLIHNGYKFGWTDPRGMPSTQDHEGYMVVDFELCQPITDEVAQIMRSV
jgi:hypothetical protein